MKALLISDTHGMLPKELPESDIIIHAGDICPDGSVKEQAAWIDEVFGAWARKANVPVYATWGNHDFVGEVDHTLNLEFGLPENVRFIVNDWIEIAGVKTYFSPYVTNLPRWAWNKLDKDLVPVYDRIPNDAQVIVSHAPPNGIMDHLPVWGHVGSFALRDRLLTHPGASMLICGHIHEGYGQAVMDRGADFPGIQCYNVAHCDANYDPVNPPVVIDWPEKKA